MKPMNENIRVACHPEKAILRYKQKEKDRFPTLRLPRGPRTRGPKGRFALVVVLAQLLRNSTEICYVKTSDEF